MGVCCEMYNFILCDDNEECVARHQDIIEKVMFKTHFEYKFHKFYDYNDDFMDIVKETLENKIYIMDVQTYSANGIYIARIIRNHDYNAHLIFVTGYYKKYRDDAIASRVLFIQFINKCGDVERDLTECIETILKEKYHKKVLSYSYKNIRYNVALSDITHIDYDDRHLKIFYGDICVQCGKALKEIFEDLDDRFVQCHKSSIVNTEQIEQIDKTNQLITFKNGKTSNLLSNSYCKDLIESMKKRDEV